MQQALTNEVEETRAESSRIAALQIAEQVQIADGKVAEATTLARTKSEQLAEHLEFGMLSRSFGQWITEVSKARKRASVLSLTASRRDLQRVTRVFHTWKAVSRQEASVKSFSDALRVAVARAEEQASLLEETELALSNGRSELTETAFDHSTQMAGLRHVMESRLADARDEAEGARRADLAQQKAEAAAEVAKITTRAREDAVAERSSSLARSTSSLDELERSLTTEHTSQLTAAIAKNEALQASLAAEQALNEQNSTVLQLQEQEALDRERATASLESSYKAQIAAADTEASSRLDERLLSEALELARRQAREQTMAAAKQEHASMMQQLVGANASLEVQRNQRAKAVRVRLAESALRRFKAAAVESCFGAWKKFMSDAHNAQTFGALESTMSPDQIATIQQLSDSYSSSRAGSDSEADVTKMQVVMEQRLHNVLAEAERNTQDLLEAHRRQALSEQAAAVRKLFLLSFVCINMPAIDRSFSLIAGNNRPS